MKKYKTILADPCWEQKMAGKYATRHRRIRKLPYSTLSVEEIKNLPIGNFAEEGCHLWLWTTNQFLKEAFEVMEAWGFKYLSTITWVKPSGCGNWFVSRTQHCLFGYKDKCKFNKERYKPTVFFANIPKKHSKKPIEFYDLIESISDKERLELFARNKRDGWDVWGNEVDSDVQLSPPIQTSNSTSLTSEKPKGFNKDLTATQQVALPKCHSDTSLNPDIKLNMKELLQSR
jgi:N6-adenosine-specific RNA methylase IME4